MKDLPSEKEIESHAKEAVSIYAIDSASRTIGFSHELSGAVWMREQAEKSLRYSEWKAERFAEWTSQMDLIYIDSIVNKVEYRGWILRSEYEDTWESEVSNLTFKTTTELKESEAFLTHLNSLPQPE